jgi:LacI family transcriptional regulator
VARLAEVSVASASRAINGLSSVTPETRKRVLEAAKSLHFVPHSGARSLSIRRNDAVGLILPDLYGEFFSELIRGVDSAARERGLHLLVSNSLGNARDAAGAMRSMRGRVDGLLVMWPHVDSADLADSIDANLPTILLNTDGSAARLPAFQIDNFRGAHAVTRHLMEIGRRKIAHIMGPAANHEALERKRGYEAALGEGAKTRVAQGAFTEDTGREAALALLKSDDPPDAIFAANDNMAIGALVALRELGLRAPHDVALAGFDDIPLSRLLDPSLTTARVRIADLGRNALERLSQWTESGEIERSSTLMQPELIVRRSSVAG